MNIAADKPRGLVWLRRDLRLADNGALQAALDAGFAPIPVYIHAPGEEVRWVRGAASNWWLHHSLLALDAELRRLGSGLVVRGGGESVRTRYGPTTAIEMDRLLAETGARAIFWSRLYDPAIVQRDGMLKQAWRERGIETISVPGNLIFEPWEIKNGSGEPYRVFTPYWRNVQSRLPIAAPLSAPMQLPGFELASESIEALGLLPTIPWDRGFHAEWEPGEAGAMEALEDFLADGIATYASDRDRPDRRGTSRLSAHLHFGEISARQVFQRLGSEQAPGLRALAEPYLRQLGWRDFSVSLLFHFPHTSELPLQPQYQEFPWAQVDPDLLAAWQRGRTGFPIIDAGMRELWATGYMHNRVRMLAASFLTKNLRYHWLHGARWFWDTLVDADLANNTQGWQWTAGSGADAAPYFRIFNPITQGERFDPAGDYVRRWVPELARLAGKAIHQPWQVGGVAGYPKPILDLGETRADALAAYAQMRGGTRTDEKKPYPQITQMKSGLKTGAD